MPDAVAELHNVASGHTGREMFKGIEVSVGLSYFLGGEPEPEPESELTFSNVHFAYDFAELDSAASSILDASGGH